MKIPEHPPKWWDILKTGIEKILNFPNQKTIANAMIKANNEYVYWDKFKYFTIPKEFSPDLIWSYLKFTRNTQTKSIPMEDKNKNRFKFWLPDIVHKELHYIDTHSPKIDIFNPNSVYESEKNSYLISSLMEEAIASSQLEGASTTREIAKVMLRSGKKPENTSEQMILNNYITMQKLKTLSNEQLSANLIKHIQSMITENTLKDKTISGRFRDKNDTDIGVYDNRDNVQLFIPPLVEEIDDRIQKLCDFVNSNNETDFIHPILKAIIMHFWLSYIHPFVDGNGRTSRALFYWYLVKNGYWKFEYFSISKVLKKAPVKYARAFLYSEIDENDLTYFLVYNLKAIHEAIDEFDLYIERKQEKQKEISLFIQNSHGFNYRQISILQNALKHPDLVFTIRSVQNTYNVVHQTARMDLAGLVKKGFLIKKRLGKQFSYIPIPNIKEKLKNI